MTDPVPHIDPKSFSHKFVTTCGYKYHYVEEGDPRGETLLLVHGFPDLWYGWRHQIKHFAKLGYHVLAVDCLGYGQTDSPMDLKEYGMRNICNQLAGVLDALNIPKVTILGHDWGGALAWRFGLYYPNRLHGIISVCTPYIPPKTTFRNLEEIVQAEPKFEYQLKYANPASTAGMDATVDEIYLTIQTKFGSMDDEDRKYVISEYKHSGFRGPLNYYKTTCVNFEDEIGLHKCIDLPCWIILAYDDPFLPIRLVYEMADYLPKLKMATIWARHFVISEKPNETNVLLKQCLDDLLLRRN